MALGDEVRERMAAKPDQWTLAWWGEQFREVLKGYRGATHGINRALAEYEDACKAIEELRGQVKQLESDREADRAKIGELQARVERHAEFLNEIKREPGIAQFLAKLKQGNHQ